MLVLLISALFVSVMPLTSSTYTVNQTRTQDSYAIQTEGNETTPKYGGTLRIGVCLEGIPGFPEESLNPLLEPGAAIFLPLFDGLTRLDETCSIIPGLAESCARYDILAVALAFGSNCGDPEYDPDLDLTKDCKIRVDDVLTAALHFGEGP